MGRPIKEGLDYFPHDTDAVNDEKIESMRALFGAEGYAFYFISLERIYRTKNGQLDISTKEKRASLTAKIGVDDDRFIEMLKASFEVGLFDRKAFDTKGLMTSKGIKRRVRQVNDERERKRQWKNRKLSTSKTDDSSGVLDGENPGKSAQRKEKHSKEKKSKEKGVRGEAPSAPPSGVFEDYAGEDAALLVALQGFDQMRTKIKRPMTDLAKKRLTQKLDKLAAEHPGMDKVDVLEEAILRCWQSVYLPKDQEENRKEDDSDVL